MFRNKVRRVDQRGFALVALLLGGSVALAGDSADDALKGWLDKEMNVYSTSMKDQIPVGGKFTLVYDASKGLVHMCTKQDPSRQKSWTGDLAAPCGVTLTFTRGTHYCTEADVKTGDAETLASCHRLRTRDVALSPPSDKGVERNDLIIFLVQGDKTDSHKFTMVVDSPSRVTAGGTTVGGGNSGGGQGGG